jgi:hypothetical protein
VYTAFLLAATCLAWDGAGSAYAGNPPGGSYGGLENGYDPVAWAAWAAIIAARDSSCGGGHGSDCGRQHRLTHLGKWISHRQDGAPTDGGDVGFSCGSCSFADSPPLGWGGAPDLGPPVVAPTSQASPGPAAAGDKK